VGMICSANRVDARHVCLNDRCQGREMVDPFAENQEHDLLVPVEVRFRSRYWVVVRAS
jgi:hypothetical protein